ncbi:MAG: hypothetical protein E7E92_04185 [Clostridiales bacterium]|nr:hypothetical protein [Clostridiales bacterium]
MENNFECYYMDIGGHCIETYQLSLEDCKMHSKKCYKCEKHYNKCETCGCPILYEEKDYCKNCINNKEGYHE